MWCIGLIQWYRVGSLSLQVTSSSIVECCLPYELRPYQVCLARRIRSLQKLCNLFSVHGTNEPRCSVLTAWIPPA